MAERRRAPAATVVVCSYRGARRIPTVLAALRRQEGPLLDVLVVDDGSPDDTAAVAERLGARVVRHEVNRGLGAARNTGLQHCRADLVAYLDDDCEPGPDWARHVTRHLGDDRDAALAGVGGPALPEPATSYLTRYLARHHAHRPLELDLVRSNDPAYRFLLYLQRNWRSVPPDGVRPVFSLLGANMSFCRAAIEDIGGFDESLMDGPEDLDLSIRLRERHGDGALLFDPEAWVVHHDHATWAGSLGRRRAYGRGHARMLAKYPDMNPTVFPLPLAVAALLLLAPRRPVALAGAAVLPHLMHPAGLRAAMSGDWEALADPYVACLQEAVFDLGLAEGLRRLRGSVATAGATTEALP